jgi:predicted nucleic acid-binding protein
MTTILVDTSVWSLALRRRSKSLSAQEKEVVLALGSAIARGWVIIIDPVRQELLSGLRHEVDYEKLRDRLHDFDHEPCCIADFEEAARFWNRCESTGIATASLDMLICSLGARLGISIWTLDSDFDRYVTCLPIRLIGLDELQTLLGRSES